MKEQYERKVIDDTTKSTVDGPVKQKIRFSFPGENFSVEAESLEDAVAQLAKHKEDNK